MSQFRDIARELHLLESVHTQLVQIGTRTDDQRQHDLIGLRRRFAEQMTEVARLGEPIFAASQDRGLEQAYRNLFSKLRSAAASHQANWPAVRIAEANEQYRQSAIAVGEAHSQFVAWMRENLARLERGLQ